MFFGPKGILASSSGIKPAPPTLEGEVLTTELPEVEVAQLCPTLCDPMNCSLPDSSVHGILRARILEWVAIPFSKGSFQPRGWTHVACIEGRFFTIWATDQIRSDQSFSRVRLFATPWIAARQASLSITNSRSTGMPLKLPGRSPNSNIWNFERIYMNPPPRPHLCLWPHCDWTQRWSSQVSFCGLLSPAMTLDASFKACVCFFFRLCAALFPWNLIFGRTLNLWWKWPTYRENYICFLPAGGCTSNLGTLCILWRFS